MTGIRSSREKVAPVQVGTAGWDFPDWHGLFYPKPLPPSCSALEWYSAYFDTVEVNTSFYQPLRPGMADKWIQIVEKRKSFTFTLKLWRRFTHERAAPPAREEVEQFKNGLAPLQEADRLGGLLLQFPWSFRNKPDSLDYLRRLLDEFSEYPIILEVRHASWDHPDLQEYLGQRNVALCNIDQPLFRDSLGPRERITSSLAYVRLHGRNHENWFRKDAGRDERYDYLYSEEELEPWVEKIDRMRRQSERLYVITNNHYRAQAAVNALQLLHRLTGRQVDSPAPLLSAYPALAKAARPSGPMGQMNLPGF